MIYEMVFTLEESLSHPTQVMFPKGKQTKQRKNSGTPRKGKSIASHSAVRHKKSYKDIESLLPTAISVDPGLQNEMGNIASKLSLTNYDNMETAREDAYEENAAESTEITSQRNASVSVIGDQKKRKTEPKITAKTPTMSCETSAVSQAELQAAVSEANDRNMQVPNDLSAEVARLKQLLLLQVSLISRQQDLLRLRDREIMQLKASNQNYKCQLTRVRRRMSTKRDSTMCEAVSPVPANRKLSVETEGSVMPTATSTGSTLVGEGSQQVSVHEACSEILQHDSSRNMEEDTLSCKTPKRKRLDSKGTNDFASVVASGLSVHNTTVDEEPAKNTSPRSEKERIPVPLSFIERRQNELFEAMMASPPDKALKEFCSIADSPSPSNVDDMTLAALPFKICDRCPHCVAIATEIARLIKIAENSGAVVKSFQPNKQSIEMMKLASVVIPGPEDAPSNLTDPIETNYIMRTSISYFRHSPSFDLDHWWWDLKCGDLKTENKLNIPTWKEQSYQPTEVSPDDATESLEPTDDVTFMKRHSKHELDERRRKRWDIQRIREYRYNEKLRQKLLKQAAVYDAPVIETFSGHLHDAEAVEVHENLPVNVFGYPAPCVKPAEFNLMPMYQMSKVLAAGAVRRRSRKQV